MLTPRPSRFSRETMKRWGDEAKTRALVIPHGPCLFITTSTFAVTTTFYAHWFSNAVGTDGEKNLVEAVLQNFPHHSHVHCFRHSQQNIEMHLRNQQFPPSVVKEYTRDIFSWNEVEGAYHKGLVDCSDIENFNTNLQSTYWNKKLCDRKSHSIDFHAWFTKCEADDFWHCSLCSLRETWITSISILHQQRINQHFAQRISWL